VEVKVVLGSFEPGQVYPELLIGTKAGGLRVLQLKPEGRGVMMAEAFLRGHPELLGATLP